MKLQLLAIPLLLALMLSPLAAAAASTVTFTSPAANASFSGTQSLTISGTITPAPALPDTATIAIANPQGQVVDFQAEAVQAGGVITPYVTNVGGNPSYISGTYTISISDSSGPLGSETFTYTATTTAPAGTTLTVIANSASTVFAGQTAQIFALAYWNNGSAAAAATWSATVYTPAGAVATMVWTKSTPASGSALWTATIPAGSADGVYAAVISATEGGIKSWTQTSFQVNSQIASASALTTLTTNLATLQTSVTGLVTSVTAIQTGLTALQTSVTGIQTGVTGIQSSVTALQTSVTGIQTGVTGIQSSVTALQSSVSGLQTGITGLQTSMTGL